MATPTATLPPPPPPPPSTLSSPPTPTTNKATISLPQTTTTNTNTNDLDERASAKAALEAAEEILRSLCASHAPTFVAVERRSAALETALENLLEKTIIAENKVVTARSCLEEEEDDNDNDDGEEKEQISSAKKLHTLAERHRLRRRTLLQHSSLLELLELPGLMEACVRSGLYDEALSVAGFANALERRHLLQPEEVRGKGRVVGQVVSDVRRREGDLRRHLLGRLRGDVTMPQCLEVVTALRRLNGVELERTSAAGGGGSSSTGNVDKNKELERLHRAMELKLQVAFLEARDSWLDAALVSGGGGGGSNTGGGGGSGGSSLQSEQILDAIDSYRTRCFEIATQFLAIFRTSNSSLSSTLPSSLPSTNKNDHSLSLLSMWTTRRIHTFLSTLTFQIHTISSTASLRDALDASLFFATSMARMGADFQPLLPPIFEPKLVNIVVGYWNEGVGALGEVLKVCRDAGVASPLYSDASTTTKTSGSAATTTALEGGDAMNAASSTTPAPPRILLTLPPLARLLNSYLTGLNELRRCLLPQTFIVLRSNLDTFLQDVESLLSTNERAVLTPGMRGDAMKLREVAKKMREVFLSIVRPYCVECLEVCFGCIVEETKEEVEEVEEEEKGQEDDDEKEEEEKIEEATKDDDDDEQDDAETKDEDVSESEIQNDNKIDVTVDDPKDEEESNENI